MEIAASYQIGRNYHYDVQLSSERVSGATIIVGIESAECRSNKAILKISVYGDGRGGLTYYVEEHDDPDAPIMSKDLPNFFEALYNEYISQ